MRKHNLPNRIIISRKGFDGTAGGKPSPVLDGKLISLPIPECMNGICDQQHVTYGELGCSDGEPSIVEMVNSLTQGTIHARRCVHLDPDLRKEIRSDRASREAEKIFAFGQNGNPQLELSGKNVDKGDLFLFFGWFKFAEKHGNCYRYMPGAQDRHLLWGWLQVGKKTDITQHLLQLQADPRYRHHPHVSHPEGRNHNFLYEASESLTFRPDLPGSGLFENYNDEFSFTKIGKYSRSKWRLPKVFKEIDVTHFTFDDWLEDGDFIIPGFRCKGCGAASQGQEFIFDPSGEHSGAISDWLEKKFACVFPRP